MASKNRNRPELMPPIPARGGKTTPNPGRNFDAKIPPTPCRAKMARVRPTHESGCSEMRQKHAQHAVPAVATEIKPYQICDQASSDGYPERHERIHHPHSPKGSGPQQPGNGREWQANLFQENDGEQHRSPVAHQEMRCFAHRLLRRLPEVTTEL